MKKKYILVILCILSMVLLSSCGKAKVNTNELNEQVNSLLENLPEDKEDYENIKEDDNGLLSLEEYEEYLNGLKEEGIITYKEKEELLERQKFILKTSEDIIYPELNFSFSVYSSKNVPETFWLYNQEWFVQCLEPCYTSLGLQNPALIMTTSILWENGNLEEKEEANEIFKTLMKQLTNDFGEIIAGVNYNVFDLDQITKENPTALMAFEALDCYVVVDASYYEISKDSPILDSYSGTEGFNGATGAFVTIYFAGKNIYHDYYGDDVPYLKYLEMYAGAKFKYYVEDSNTQGGYYLIDRQTSPRINIY